MLRPKVGQTSAPSNQLAALPQHSLPTDREAWCVHWQARGQPWRTEPEIDRDRQEYLAEQRAIVPNIEEDIYPFKGVKLNRASVEWLLATHENGRGPVDWSDEQQHTREGLDLRGADLRHQDLHNLPLACLCAGLSEAEDLFDVMEERVSNAAAQMQKADLSGSLLQGSSLGGTQLQRTNLRQAQMQKANLWNANLQEARLNKAQLQQSSLRQAQMQKANLWNANLQSADLTQAQLQGAILILAQLKNAILFKTRLQKAHLGGAQLQGASLTQTQLQEADLIDIVLSDKNLVGPQTADAQWEGTNLAVVDWSQVKMLGDEYKVRQKKQNGKVKENRTRWSEYLNAVRANRQLAVALQNQGLNEDAARFAYRAQVLQKNFLGFQMTQSGLKLRQWIQLLKAWSFSWFLFFLAGYGYKPGRSFLAYLFVIIGFATVYYLLGLHDIVGSHHVFGPHYLTWYEAFVVSMTAFHGRGFFANQFQPGDPQALVAACEAFVGLIIEVTFIATLTQRFFNR